jgi:NTP pyrophosphatase (non-canonical NTP hydrolase)
MERTSESKSEIRARIDELSRLKDLLNSKDQFVIEDRISDLEDRLDNAPNGIVDSVLLSHKVICDVKGMGPKAAYGQDPIMYYSLAVCGEAGEMSNKIVKAHRNGYNHELAMQAVISELPDIFIYAVVLAHVCGVDIIYEVNKKVEIVMQRAKDGYYGGKIHSEP